MTDSQRPGAPEPAQPRESEPAQPRESGPPESQPPASALEPTVHGFFVQAPIAPLDEDGIVVLSVGTAAFCLASIGLWLAWDRLVAAHDQWWLAVALTGVVLGLLGLLYCWRRRRR
ncbi:MAG TPA: hypothetical protein VFP34_07785 [Microlunatus sp.]|nr:hypothetical protein [Microlunatus sp.]